MRADVACATTGGAVKPQNEDCVVVNATALCSGCFSGSFPAPFMVTVVDGVSAGGQGARAASIAASCLVKAFSRSTTSLGALRPLRDVAMAALDEAHAQMIACGGAAGSAGPAAAVASAVFSDEGAVILHAGDARVYRLRQGILARMTSDHTMVQELKDAGAAQEYLDQANPHAITRALGVPSKRAHAADAAEAPVVLPGDVYLICSDGLSGFVPDDRLEAILDGGGPLPEMARLLLDAALEAGSTDNVSAALARVSE